MKMNLGAVKEVHYLQCCHHYLSKKAILSVVAPKQSWKMNDAHVLVEKTNV
jgi:hypothetical protein